MSPKHNVHKFVKSRRNYEAYARTPCKWNLHWIVDLDNVGKYAKYNNLHAAEIFYANSVKAKIWKKPLLKRCLRKIFQI